MESISSWQFLVRYVLLTQLRFVRFLPALTYQVAKYPEPVFPKESTWKRLDRFLSVRASVYSHKRSCNSNDYRNEPIFVVSICPSPGHRSPIKRECSNASTEHTFVPLPNLDTVIATFSSANQWSFAPHPRNYRCSTNRVSVWLENQLSRVVLHFFSLTETANVEIYTATWLTLSIPSWLGFGAVKMLSGSRGIHEKILDNEDVNFLTFLQISLPCSHVSLQLLSSAFTPFLFPGFSHIHLFLTTLWYSKLSRSSSANPSSSKPFQMFELLFARLTLLVFPSSTYFPIPLVVQWCQLDHTSDISLPGLKLV